MKNFERKAIMARLEEEHIAAAMKAAKTGKEVTGSWLLQRPGYEPKKGPSPFALWAERNPEMIHLLAHNHLTYLLDKGVLDPKTRYLVIVACYIMEGHWEGLPVQCSNARAAGATEEEIMEVALITGYAVSKAKLVDTSHALKDIFDSDAFKNTKRLG